MKKLFFAALVAMVAVGGATYADTLNEINGPAVYNCEGDIVTCNSTYGKSPSFQVSTAPWNGTTPQSPTTYVLLSDFLDDGIIN